MTEMEQDTFITVQFKNAVTGEITGEPVELPVNTSVAILTKLCNSLLEKVIATVFITNFFTEFFIVHIYEMYNNILQINKYTLGEISEYHCQLNQLSFYYV